MIGLVLTAAGASTRFGGPAPKVLADLGGRAVVRRALDAFLAVDAAIAVVVTAPPGHEAALAALLPEARVVAGGATRQASVTAGVLALPPAVDLVLVHDAARPLVSPDLVAAVLAATRAGGAALPVVPVTDTLHRVATMPPAGGTARVSAAPDRAGLVRAQTPQGARRAWLETALVAAEARGQVFTDEASLLLAAGHPVLAVAGEPTNLKITLAEDLEEARRHV